MGEKENLLKSVYEKCNTYRDFIQLINSFKCEIKEENRCKIEIKLREFCKRKLTNKEIAKKLKFSCGHINTLKRKYGLTDIGRIRLKPILKPSKDLAYILGVLKGDGYVFIFDWKPNKECKSTKHYIIGLNVKDVKFAESFKGSIKNIGLRVKVRKYRSYYVCKFCNKELLIWYKKLSINDIKEIIEKDEEYVKEFLRGFYESEGYYYYEGDVKRPYIGIINCKFDLINLVNNLINKLSFDTKLYKLKRSPSAFKKGIYYKITIRKKEQPEKFIKTIKPCIKNIPTNKWF